MFKLRNILAVLGLAILAGCADPSADPIEEIQARTYVSDEPPSITIFTVVNDESEFGEHTGILINASQQVLWDPAGSFRSINLARSKDVFYGMTPQMVDYYVSYHARFGYYVVAQKLEVTPEVAEAVYRRAVAQGATGKLRCTIAATSVLNGVPEFSQLSTTFFPGKLMEEFAQIPGVVTTITRENDEGQNYAPGVNAI